ncbi:GGDEF domain-containing protein [Clostridium sp. SYSU_GA19001]|uniref:GGDEF domain-containing protein n=1 Tax=Clostridium caldaquaticum TaxID=2940653 RepID=UPI00207726F8|nr:GGDEF domain-containing protein [Clostridium caldaquaticum]MCM8709428.1 GGDEF domain-containing protein [Clostridium caldaquaticum]
MIKKAFDIIENNILKVNVLNATRKIQDIFQEKGTGCFIVYEEDKLTGVITKNELIGSHPNRIAADIMSHKYMRVDYGMYIWEIKEIFDLNEDINVILVEKENEVIGYITRTALNMELSKHIDLLTGLYKSEYMFYNTYKFIKHGKHATIIFIDLNNFGYVDKKYGHIVGDTILKNVSDILRNNLNPNSYLCRYAGDEFAIATPYCIEESKLLAEKIMRAIKSYPFLNDIPVSASIGITGCKIQNNKFRNISTYINKLVNTASLASTMAKKDINNLIIVENVEIDEIA